MWKRDEAVKPPQPAAPVIPALPQEPPAVRADVPRHQEKDTVNIGKSVVIKGDLSGSEDLTIEGQVEGKIELRQNVLTIGANGKIKAAIFAKIVVVLGDVQGDITASERIDIRDSGSVDGEGGSGSGLPMGLDLGKQILHQELASQLVTEERNVGADDRTEVENDRRLDMREYGQDLWEDL